MAGSVTHSDWKDPVCPRCEHPWDTHSPKGCQYGNIMGTKRECNCQYGFPVR